MLDAPPMVHGLPGGHRADADTVPRRVNPGGGVTAPSAGMDYDRQHRRIGLYRCGRQRTARLRDERGGGSPDGGARRDQ
jgi:hypothetical protein